jgi:uncharacterized repeat protein (TIGR03803 family)
MKRKRLSPYPSPRFTLLVVLLAFVGAAFSPAASQSENILHRFSPSSTTDGFDPGSGLVADKAGNLYGTTSQGGADDCGIVFELSPPAPGGGAWIETILHDFTNNSDGCSPIGALTIDNNGSLFGTTVYGGVGVEGNSYGTAFELSPPSEVGGSWTYAVIASFDSGVVAIYPAGQMAIDASGNLYGFSDGGNNNYPECGGNCGNIFELQPPAVAGGAWTGLSIYNFKGGTTDGFDPTGIILGPDGVLYGTTGEGGPGDWGTFFKLTPPGAPGGAWTEHVLYGFTPANPAPSGGVIAGREGTYFGTGEGLTGLGTVFELIPPSAGKGWTESVLYSFTHGTDGYSPFGVISDKSGNLYGAALDGGNPNPKNCLSAGCGTVYELSPPAAPGGAWTETTLYDFAGGSDGGNPKGPLVLLKGLLFGATSYGGTPNVGSGGTVFRITP